MLTFQNVMLCLCLIITTLSSYDNLQQSLFINYFIFMGVIIFILHDTFIIESLSSFVFVVSLTSHMRKYDSSCEHVINIFVHWVTLHIDVFLPCGDPFPMKNNQLESE